MISVKSLCQKYLQEHSWLAGRTKDGTERAFRYLAYAVGNLRIDQIKYAHLERYKNWLIVGRSKTSANIYLRSLGPVFTWAVKLELMKSNPTIGLQQFAITRRPNRIYEDWDFARMLRFSPDLRWRAIIMAARTGGLRRGEILNLTRDNIRNGFIYIEPKRDTKQQWPWEPKTRQNRMVPLVEPLAELLKSLPCFYPLLPVKRYDYLLGLKADGLLSEEQIRCPVSNFRRTFVMIQRKAFGRQIGTFHSLRKTYVTEQAMELPAWFVGKLAGHNLRTMETHYLSVRDSLFETARKVALKGIRMAYPVGPDRPDTKKLAV